ncbi:MAG: hypothetical protein U0X73_05760 [Thermoanaerobaculia bacterium]
MDHPSELSGRSDRVRPALPIGVRAAPLESRSDPPSEETARIDTPETRRANPAGRAATLALAVGLLTQIACATVADPAVRLARCMKQAARAGALASSCDLRVPGAYLVVLCPQGDLKDADLLAAGVPAKELERVRQLRLGSRPAVLVIPDAAAGRPTRSTFQARYVRIPRALAAQVESGGSLDLQLSRDPTGLQVTGVR